MRGSIRKSFFAAVVALLCFAPGAFAQVRATSAVTAPSFTSSVGIFVFNPIGDDWDRKKKKKKVAASEGGSAALYLLFAGLACGGAVLLRSRRSIAAKAV